MKKYFVIFILISLCLIKPGGAFYEGFFGTMDNVQIAGTIKVQNHFDRYIDFKINKAVLNGTVTAEHYSPRTLKLQFTPASITGRISGAAHFYDRFINFSIQDRHISGSFTTEELSPRLLELEVSDNKMGGTLFTERYTPRYISLLLKKERLKELSLQKVGTQGIST